MSWGQREFKFAKQGYSRPVIDVESLSAQDPSLGEWVNARRHPKLLIATQTRVVEVWVDERGHAIPATPVLSIEPESADPQVLWMLAAALTAPVIRAHFLASKFGTAMSLNAMKLAARDVLAVPLPSVKAAWVEASALISEDAPDLKEFAELMGIAYGVEDASLVSWWLDRLPNHSKSQR